MFAVGCLVVRWELGGLSSKLAQIGTRTCRCLIIYSSSFCLSRYVGHLLKSRKYELRAACPFVSCATLDDGQHEHASQRRYERGARVEYSATVAAEIVRPSTRSEQHCRSHSHRQVPLQAAKRLHPSWWRAASSQRWPCQPSRRACHSTARKDDSNADGAENQSSRVA